MVLFTWWIVDSHIFSYLFALCNVAFKLGRQSHAKTHLQLQEQDENKDPWPQNSPQLHLEGGMMQICHYCCTTHGLYGILAAAHWHEHFYPPNSVAFLVQVTGVGAYKFKDFMPPALSWTLRGLMALLAKQRHHSFVLSAPEIDMQEAPVLQANSGQPHFGGPSSGTCWCLQRCLMSQQTFLTLARREWFCSPHNIWHLCTSKPPKHQSIKIARSYVVPFRIFYT